MNIYELLSALILFGFLFICFLLLITVFGSIFLFKIHKNIKSRGIVPSLSLLEKSLLSFGIGISIYISICYVINFFGIFNIFTSYIPYIIVDGLFITYYLIKQGKDIRIKYFNKDYIRDLINLHNIISICIFIFISVLVFIFSYNVIIENDGLQAKDPYWWTCEIYLTLKNAKLGGTISWFYPAGYTFFCSGIILPVPPSLKSVYFFVKLLPIYLMLLFFFISFVILRRIFTKNYLLLISLLLLLSFEYFMNRAIYGLPSLLVTSIIGISFIILINEGYPKYILSFFISAIFFIHSLSVVYYLLALTPYLLLIIFSNIRDRNNAKNELKSIIFLIVSVVILIIPYIINEPTHLLDVMIYYSSKVFGKVNSLNPFFNFNRNNLLFIIDEENYSFGILEGFFDNRFVSYFKRFLENTIGYFCIALLFGLILNLFQKRDDNHRKFLFLFFSMCCLIALSFYFAPFFIDTSEFLKEFKYRPFEVFALPVTIITLTTFEWIIDGFQKIYLKIIEEIEKLKDFKRNHAKLVIILNPKIWFIALCIISVFEFYQIRIKYESHYLYDENYIDIYWYLGDNAKDGSILLRPVIDSWNWKPDGRDVQTEMLYNVKPYYFHEVFSINSLILKIQDIEADYLIYPKEWENKDGNIIEVLDDFNGFSNVIKFTDTSEEGNINLYDNFGCQESGIIDWWLYRENYTDTRNLKLSFYNYNWYKKIQMFIDNTGVIYNNYNKTNSVIYSNFTHYDWHHFKIEFNFEEEENGLFNLYIDEKLIVIDLNMKIKKGSNIFANLYGLNFKTTRSNETFYIYGLNYSWEEFSWNPRIPEISEIYENDKYILYEVD